MLTCLLKEKGFGTLLLVVFWYAFKILVPNFIVRCLFNFGIYISEINLTQVH